MREGESCGYLRKRMPGGGHYKSKDPEVGATLVSKNDRYKGEGEGR